eukprot:TRINITY_DN1871_c1_g1_i2.p1 TRINITY_DN1871_c1_g1~~TRINITY_DN1871_c1_g1_i2.p1  ORF type:complete len:749 (-),score=211.27 TRINITY_DN1871_c1_g1_i2:51-2297(-)
MSGLDTDKLEVIKGPEADPSQDPSPSSQISVPLHVSNVSENSSESHPTLPTAPTCSNPTPSASSSTSSTLSASSPTQPTQPTQPTLPTQTIQPTPTGPPSLGGSACIAAESRDNNNNNSNNDNNDNNDNDNDDHHHAKRQRVEETRCNDANGKETLRWKYSVVNGTKSEKIRIQRIALAVTPFLPEALLILDPEITEEDLRLTPDDYAVPEVSSFLLETASRNKDGFLSAEQILLFLRDEGLLIFPAVSKSEQKSELIVEETIKKLTESTVVFPPSQSQEIQPLSSERDLSNQPSMESTQPYEEKNVNTTSENSCLPQISVPSLPVQSQQPQQSQPQQPQHQQTQFNYIPPQAQQITSPMQQTANFSPSNSFTQMESTPITPQQFPPRQFAPIQISQPFPQPQPQPQPFLEQQQFYPPISQSQSGAAFSPVVGNAPPILFQGSPSPQPVQTQKAPLRCPSCFQRFDRFVECTRHIAETKHAGAFCSVCHACILTDSQMLQHNENSGHLFSGTGDTIAETTQLAEDVLRHVRCPPPEVLEKLKKAAQPPIVSAPKPPEPTSFQKPIPVKTPFPIPTGWEAMLDPKSGKMFFIDHNTKTTRWELPKIPPKEAIKTPVKAVAANQNVQTKANSLPNSLPAGWEEKKDSSGNSYYVNRSLGISQWGVPSEVPNPNPIQPMMPIPGFPFGFNASPFPSFFSTSSPFGLLGNAAVQDEKLPAGWQKMIDPTGKVYYTDHNTKTTHWSLPAPIKK